MTDKPSATPQLLPDLPSMNLTDEQILEQANVVIEHLPTRYRHFFAALVRRSLHSEIAPPEIPRRSLRAMRWACDIFGWIARDEQERAMRFAEEAAELVHAVGLSKDVVLAIVERVYSRAPGEVAKEVGQAALTLELLGEVVGVVADDAATREFNRIQAIPREEWQRRHQAKVEMGIAK